MPSKVPFIDKANSQTFQLVHRSQRDPLISDSNSSSLVLKLISQNNNTNNAVNTSTDVKNNDNHSNNDLQNYGVYFDDGYDYMKHLREINPNSNDSLFIKATNNTKQIKQGLKFKDENAQQALNGQSNINLPSEVLEGNTILPIGLMNQPANEFEGLQLDLDEDLREVLLALDDEAYVEQEEEEYFDSLNLNQVPSKYAELIENSLEDDDNEEEGWMKEFKKFQKARG